MQQSIANTTTQANLTQIDRLAGEARIYRASLNMNFAGLARVLAEARPLIPHGQWAGWVAENADVSEKTAGDMIAWYRRYAGNPRMEGLGVSKMLKMLALPEGSEDAFMDEYDVESMTVREVQEAVKQARAEAQAEIDAERRARLAAERRAVELEENAPPPVELVDENMRLKSELGLRNTDVENARAVATEAIGARDEAMRERRNAEAEAEKYRTLFNRQRESYDKVVAELMSMKSAEAKGEAERVPTGLLTPDAFDHAARAFITACSRMPTMGTTFASMAPEDWREYDETLKTIERWTTDSRRALNRVEGELIYG